MRDEIVAWERRLAATNDAIPEELVVCKRLTLECAALVEQQWDAMMRLSATEDKIVAKMERWERHRKKSKGMKVLSGLLARVVVLLASR